jgi:hypothetical protein
MTLVIPLILATTFATKGKGKQLALVLLALGCYYLLILTASRVSFVAYLGSIFVLLLLLNKKWWIVPIMALSLLGSSFSEDINQRFAATIKIEGPKIAEQISSRFLSLLPDRSTNLTSIDGLKPTPTEEEKAETSTTTTGGTNQETGQSIPLKPTLTPTPLPALTKEETAQINVERSGDIRFGVEWPRAIRQFKKNPLLGTGYSSLTLATDNGYLRALGETGILGLLALLSIFIAQIPFYAKTLSNKKIDQQTKYLTAGLASTTLALLASILFIDGLESSKVAFSYWLILGLIVGRVNLEKEK